MKTFSHFVLCFFLTSCAYVSKSPLDYRRPVSMSRLDGCTFFIDDKMDSKDIWKVGSETNLLSMLKHNTSETEALKKNVEENCRVELKFLTCEKKESDMTLNYFLSAITLTLYPIMWDYECKAEMKISNIKGELNYAALTPGRKYFSVGNIFGSASSTSSYINSKKDLVEKLLNNYQSKDLGLAK